MFSEEVMRWLHVAQQQHQFGFERSFDLYSEIGKIENIPRKQAKDFYLPVLIGMHYARTGEIWK